MHAQVQRSCVSSSISCITIVAPVIRHVPNIFIILDHLFVNKVTYRRPAPDSSCEPLPFFIEHDLGLRDAQILARLDINLGRCTGLSH